MINISTLLFLVLFLSFDLVHFELNKMRMVLASKFFIPVVSVMLIVTMSYFYSGGAINKIREQCAFGQRGLIQAG